jgi:dolichol-phosphate mannosyltransferase
MKKLLSIVTNTYFAEKFIISSLERIRKVANEIRETYDLDVEIIIVDDGSKDRTIEILTKAYEAKKDFTLLVLTKNFGAVNSYRAGIEEAKGDAVVHLASDMQEPPEVIPQMIKAWQDGFKFVYCFRKTRKDPLVSKIFSKIYYGIFIRFSQIKDFPKTGFDMVLMERQVVNTFLSYKEKHYTPQQLIWSFGFKSFGIPINREERLHGKSGWSFSKKITLAIDTMISMSYLPIRTISVIGFITSILSILYGIYIAYGAIFGNIKVEGWASIVCIISFLLGIVMLMLGIMGEYLWRIFAELKNRPSFIIDKTFEIKK